MALFKSLFPHPQQFCVHGVTYFLNPGETKEFPDVFRGRYNGLIEEVIQEIEQVATSETPEDLDNEPDDILSVVEKANAEALESEKQSEKEKEISPVEDPVPQQKKNTKKKAG